MKKTEESLNIGYGLKKVLNFLKCLILPLIIYLIFAVGSEEGLEVPVPCMCF